MAQQQGECCAQLRPQAEPTLQQQGLQWADVLSMVEPVDSQDELQEALMDAEFFLKKLLAEACDQVARKLFLFELKPHLEPLLQQQGLAWIDVQPALELVDSLAELKKAISDPQACFFRSLSTVGGPAVRRMLIAQHRPRAKPILQKQGLQWADVLPTL